MKRIDCYLCRSKSFKNLYLINNYRIVKCNNCGFIYLNEVITNNDNSEFYKSFDYKIETNPQRLINDSRRCVSIINKFKPDKGRLLDIGCGKGFLLVEAERFGWIGKGIDISQKMINYAKKINKLDVEKCDYQDFVSKNKFEVIILMHIIEHVQQPSLLIDKCKSMLKNKGILYIITPNIESLSAKSHKENFDHLIPPQHVGFYNRDTLNYLLNKSNFKAIYSKTWGYPEDLAGIIKKIFRKSHGQVFHSGTKFIDVNNRKIWDIRRIKYILFDQFFCKLFYKILNIDNFGINLEMVFELN